MRAVVIFKLKLPNSTFLFPVTCPEDGRGKRRLRITMICVARVEGCGRSCGPPATYRR